jgi:hypothetical protein
MVQEKMGKVLRVGSDRFGRVQKDIERKWRVTAGHGLDVEATNSSCNEDLEFPL